MAPPNAKRIAYSCHFVCVSLEKSSQACMAFIAKTPASLREKRRTKQQRQKRLPEWRANEPSGEFSWIRKRREQRLWHPQSFSGLRSQLRFAIGKHSETERGENNARSGAKQARPVPASRHRLVRLKTKRPIHLPAIETRSRSFRSSEEAATHRACELCSTLVGIVAGAF
jgi:hypothetical protein